MGLELFEGDIGGGVFCLSEAVIHDNDGAIGAIAGGGAAVAGGTIEKAVIRTKSTIRNLRPRAMNSHMLLTGV